MKKWIHIRKVKCACIEMNWALHTTELKKTPKLIGSNKNIDIIILETISKKEYSTRIEALKAFQFYLDHLTHSYSLKMFMTFGNYFGYKIKNQNWNEKPLNFMQKIKNVLKKRSIYKYEGV